jgi:hypothetical protein
VSCLITNRACVCNNEKISASSFYPGRGDNTHVLAQLDHGNHAFHAPGMDDDGFETEEDFLDDEHTVELARKYPSKFSESMVIEVSLQSYNAQYLLTDNRSHRGHCG